MPREALLYILILSEIAENQCMLVVNSLVASCLDYGNSLYYRVAERFLNQLQSVLNYAAEVVTKELKRFK